MPLTKLQFRPGINRETTSYTNEGGWFDCDKVRFRFGYPEKIGGWIKRSSNSFLGSCRALHPWVTLSGNSYIGVGTHLKYYVNEGGGYNDVTPLRSTTAAGDVTFAAADDTLSANVAVDDTTISLTSASGFPETGIIKINSEIIEYAGVSGNDLTGCTRGIRGTTAATHSSSDVVTCATIIVTDNDHGALVNDFVTFSGASSLGDQITADVLNQEYQVFFVESGNVNTYYINAREVGTINALTEDGEINDTLVFATSSDSGDGGASVVGAYQINTGLDTTIVGTGWGAGTWSRGAWGSAANISTSGLQLRLWAHDNFGEDLIFNVRDGGIYYLDSSLGLTSRATAISDLSGATSSTPVVAKQVLVSDRDRHIIAFGCNPETSTDQDPLLIRFSSAESVVDWAATATNSAGDLRLGSGSEIITAVETRQQILVFTDVSVHAMQYLGPPFTFGIQLISENTTIMSPNSAVAVDDTVFWMGAEEFYVYAGGVQKLPCTVRDFVFNDFNDNQAEKVVAAVNSSFSEIWWFYPAADSDNVDRYVIYNYEQQVWYYGTLARSAWIDRGINTQPIAAGTDGYLYLHEFGTDDGSGESETGIEAYIESSQIDLQDGERFAFIRRIIPDLTFRDSTAETPSATFTLKARNFPGGNYLQDDDAGVTKTASLPVEQFTDQVHVRLRGRSFAVRVHSEDLGVTWRLGSPRVDVRQDGGR
jgi:hypothetical protein